MKYFMIPILSGLIVLMSFIIKSKEIKKEKQEKKISNAATLLLKPEVPVLCYHRIRNILASDSENMKTYSVSPTRFAQQMKTLSENGFHPISPNQLYDYLIHDGVLPPKPILITFDDGREEQYRLGIEELNKYGFKGVFFIMTVSMGRPGYMSRTQIKHLSDNGHTIGAHTWDHHPVTNYEYKDWNIQLIKPKKQLEEITGKKVSYFAYPFGAWNTSSIPKIKNCGYELAFILSTKRNLDQPLFTIRRLIVTESMSRNRMITAIETAFKQ
jgi:peptidoglycan/xylan/chitin deacetylase (PgdA/CDA1 family)